MIRGTMTFPTPAERIWTPAKVGCHWLSDTPTSAIISTTHGPKWITGYVAVVEFHEIGRFPSLDRAQQAVAQWDMLRSWGVPRRRTAKAR